MELQDNELAGKFAAAVEGAINMELGKIEQGDYNTQGLTAFLKLVDVSKEFTGDKGPLQITVQWVETCDPKPLNEE